MQGCWPFKNWMGAGIGGDDTDLSTRDSWRQVLEPVVERYRKTGVRLYFRADAAFK